MNGNLKAIKNINLTLRTMLNNKSILITGGTGSLGKELVKTILHKWPEVKRLVVFSRDEQKQYQMAQEFPESKYHCMRYFIGDVRDKENGHSQVLIMLSMQQQ